MWMDVRASEEARPIEESGDLALKYNGFGSVSAEWGLPKALWLKENEPETYRSATRICDCADWLIHQLTGEWVASLNIASAKFYYNRNEGGFPESLYQEIWIEDLLGKFPARVVDVGTVVGDLRKEAAEELGLRSGIPVAEGASMHIWVRWGWGWSSPASWPSSRARPTS